MLAFLLLAPPVIQGPAPMSELLATYPRGEILCSTLTPDGARTFTADGATLTVLDTSTFLPELHPSRVVARIPLSDVPHDPILPLAEVNPDPTPNQMLFHRGSTETASIFLAGGTAGMVRVDLSRGYFESGQPQTNVVTSLGTPFTTNGQVGDANTHRWKRCVDVALVEQAGRKLVFGLFAASQQHGGTGVFGGAELGATELVAWEFTGDGPATFYARRVFDSALVPPGPSGANILGTAIAADPGDPDHLYVALGIQWLWRVDIASASGGNFTGSTVKLTLSPAAAECNGLPCSFGERMRDIAIVRRSVGGGITQPLLYAAMEYGRLFEIQLPAGGTSTATLISEYRAPCGFGERVAAVAYGSGNVLVAFGLGVFGSWYADTAAPYRPTGIWRDPCVVVGVDDPNDPLNPPTNPIAIPCGNATIRVLRRTSTTPLAALNLSGTNVLSGAIQTKDTWGAIHLRSVSSSRFHLHEAISATGLTIHELSTTSGSQTTMMGGLPNPPPRFVTTVAHYAGWVLGAGDGVVPLGDDSLAYFGGESIGHYPTEGFLVRVVQAGSEWQLSPIPRTVSACASRDEPLPTDECDLQSPYFKQVRRDPNPFLGGILGSASWVDPWASATPDDVDHPLRLWLVTGSRQWRRGGCSTPGSANCLPNPCPNAEYEWRFSWLPSFDIYSGNDLAARSRVGFSFVRLDPLQPSGDWMDMRWWQIASPTFNPDAKKQTTDLTASSNDPRVDLVGANQAQVPKLVHVIRQGSEYGYKILSPYAFMTKSDAVCPGQSADDRGRGQELLSTPLETGKPAFYELLTHVEFEAMSSPPDPSQDCKDFVSTATCSLVPSGLKTVYNSKSHTFRLTTSTFGTRYVTAVAAGFVNTDSHPQQGPLCQWNAEGGRFLVAFYDVTSTPGDAVGLSSTPPTLLRVAVGPDVSHAFSVRTKTYPDGKTLVFVGELLGRVYVLDVSGDVLFSPAATSPYLTIGCAQAQPPNCTPILRVLSGPGASFEFPADVVDGRRPNLLDIEIDGDVLYCALGRAGVAWIDISRPAGTLNLTLLASVETPGLAQGLTFRGEGATRQMLVGDSRAGLRLYGRAP